MVNAYTYEPFSLDDVINFALHAADSVNKRRPASSSQQQQQQQQQAQSTTPAATATPHNPHHQTVKRTWQPDVDLYESADSVIVEIALPGVDKSAINLEFDQKSNRLLVTGESKRRELHAPTSRKATVVDGDDAASSTAVTSSTSSSTASSVASTQLKAVRHERPNGPFERAIGFNQQAVKSDDISANFDNGILVLTIPKDVAKEQKRKIAIA